MGFFDGPSIVTSGLVLSLDAADRNSYVGSGTVWGDMSGNNNTGTLTNGPTFSSANGGSIVFNGTNDYVTASDSTSLRPTSFSIDTWFRPTSFGQFNVVVVKPATAAPWSAPYLSYMIRINTSGTVLECSLNTGGTYRAFQTSYTFSTNTTYNISFTANASTGALVVYLNGSVLNSTTTTAGDITYAAFPLIIGASYGASPVGEFFAGSIYSVKIYNKILSASEILQNYNQLKSRFNL
jgi:hypothetical protein